MIEFDKEAIEKVMKPFFSRYLDNPEKYKKMYVDSDEKGDFSLWLFYKIGEEKRRESEA